MKRALQLLLFPIAALYLVGGHWGVMQVVAWSSMIAEYSGDRGLMEGVMDTFDGEHPCAMCKAIAEERQKEEQQNHPNSNLVLENLAKWFSLSAGTDLPEERWSEAGAALRPDASDSLSGRGCGAPPVPPPRHLI